jgi:serine/threonine protein kinase
MRIYDFEELYRTVFIIEEYSEGESLEDLLKRIKTIPIPRAIDFLTQICQGLSYAHQQGIVHQDVKPANIYVQPDDRLKILDFGLACPKNTEDSMLSGSLFYMAPEQIEGNPVDQRTDIYALGITAFEMMTSKRPFPETDLIALEEMHRTQEIPDPADVVPNLPDELRGFILKACRRDPDQRYQDMNQALESIQPLAEKYSAIRNRQTSEKRKMTTVFLIYKDEHQSALDRLMEEFSSKANEHGIILKVTDYQV